MTDGAVDGSQNRTTAGSPILESLLQEAPSGSGLSPQLLSSPGGFLWWYLDLVTEDGDALVVIWSFGLPFLPGYADAVRRGCPRSPEQRPSLNVALYRRGVPEFYLLQEFPPREVDWHPEPDGDRWRYGDSYLRSITDGDRRRIELDLDLDVPHLDAPIRFWLDQSGPGARRPGESHDSSHRSCNPLPDHDWAPLLCAVESTMKMEIAGRRADLTGRLYHDRNGGWLPLHELGIKNWLWGRVALPDRELIYYILDGRRDTGQSMILTVDNNGRIESFPEASVERDEVSKNLGGLRWWPSMTIGVDERFQLRIEHRDVVDSGPFYLRSIPTATDQSGRSFRGVAEFCEPSRIDRTLHRPLVNMRVDHRRSKNSMWLPLFCGPRRGRLRRMIKSILPWGEDI